jgi:hypothetical protein
MLNGGWLVNNELEMIWKEVTVAWVGYYPGICLEGLREPINCELSNPQIEV